MKFTFIIAFVLVAGLQGCALRETDHSTSPPLSSSQPGPSSASSIPMEESPPPRRVRDSAPPLPVVGSPGPSPSVVEQPRSQARPARSTGVKVPAVSGTAWIGQVLLLVPGVEHQLLSDREAAFYQAADAKERPIPLFEQAIVLANTRAALAGMREVDRPRVLMERGRLRLIFPSGADPGIIARAVTKSLGVKEVNRVYVALGW